MVSWPGRAEGPSTDVLPSPAFEKKVTACMVSYVVMMACDGLHIKIPRIPEDATS